jgi:hypothetical protein
MNNEKEIIITIDNQEYVLKRTKTANFNECKKCALLQKCKQIGVNHKYFHKLDLCNVYYGYWIKKQTKRNIIMTERELIEKCKIYLNWLDLYMTETDQGKILWNAASPYIYQSNDLSINAIEKTFEMIIEYYFKKSDDKFDNCIDRILLNYFMLNYCVINEPTLCERYGKAILDNAEYFKQSPAFQEHLKKQKSEELNIELEKENKILKKALEIACKELSNMKKCPHSHCKYFENNCEDCWKQYFINKAQEQ